MAIVGLSIAAWWDALAFARYLTLLTAVLLGMFAITPSRWNRPPEAWVRVAARD